MTKRLCIVCKQPHKLSGIFCSEHHNELTKDDKDRYVKMYNSILTSGMYIDKNRYSLILMMPRRDADGNFIDDLKAEFIVNGEKMKSFSPIVIKIDENKIVDMRFQF